MRLEINAANDTLIAAITRKSIVYKKAFLPVLMGGMLLSLRRSRLSLPGIPAQLSVPILDIFPPVFYFVATNNTVPRL